MSDVNQIARSKALIVQSDAQMRLLLEDYKAGNLPPAQLLESFVAHLRSLADYKSTVLTMMLAEGCSKEQIDDFILGTIGAEWPNFLLDA